MIPADKNQQTIHRRRRPTDSEQPDVGVLYVVATPIGNLGDCSERMRHTLQSVNRIAAEDTRRTRQLLSHIGVDTPCFSMHQHNERQKLEMIVSQLQQGESIALVSDAGTPLISDPGYPLVNALRELEMPVVPIPGPCALVTALSVSGLPSDRFVFEGFLPAKSAARRARLRQLVQQENTQIFYESSHRIEACVADMASIFGAQRRLVITRELTKTFETILDASAGEIGQIIAEDLNQRKGEFVVLVKGAEKEPTAVSDEAKQLAQKLAEYLPGKQAAKISAEIHGTKKNLLYQFLLSEQKK